MTHPLLPSFAAVFIMFFAMMIGSTAKWQQSERQLAHERSELYAIRDIILPDLHTRIRILRVEMEAQELAIVLERDRMRGPRPFGFQHEAE